MLAIHDFLLDGLLQVGLPLSCPDDMTVQLKFHLIRHNVCDQYIQNRFWISL